MAVPDTVLIAATQCRRGMRTLPSAESAGSTRPPNPHRDRTGVPGPRGDDQPAHQPRSLTIAMPCWRLADGKNGCAHVRCPTKDFLVDIPTCIGGRGVESS
jgi:hypothetical protein